MKLTPQTLKKLYAFPLEVRRWNGNFNRVEIQLKINKRHYHIEVYHANESLRDYGVMSSVFTEPVRVWYEYRLVEEIPDELLPLIDKMKEVCKMTPEQTAEIKANMIQAFKQYQKDFCL